MASVGAEGGPCTQRSPPQETEPCYVQTCKDCPWSPWTPWSHCSCSFLVQQRYRNQQGWETDREPCLGLDGQFRMCNYSQCSESSCEPPFEFRACGSPCDSHCSTLKHPELCKDIPHCLPGCYCPQVSLQHRYRFCLDPQTGQIWSGPDSVCTAELEQQQLCVEETGACQDFCLWSEWGAWSPCQAPCGGSFRLRQRGARHPDAELHCKGLRYQSETCNMAPCPGNKAGVSQG
ncbi:hypothetical protein E2320_022701 [Naja naja]|nr:hypothetical protein E2320_022701 [Naja naja]